MKTCKHCGAVDSYRKETDLVARLDYLLCTKCGDVYFLDTEEAVDISKFREFECVICGTKFQVPWWGKKVCSDECDKTRKRECSKKYKDEHPEYWRKKMKLLVKIPTRGRPGKFTKLLETYILYTKDRENTHFLITCDKDDDKMMDDRVIDWLASASDAYKNMTIVFGLSANKVAAINRDIDKHGPNDWEVLLLTSDDMIPLVEGYDNIIREEMKSSFPDTDGVLWFKDGYTPLNTLPIIGRKYYERFGYVYNPEYESFFCDNEFHEVSFMLDKVKTIETVIIRHDHPANTGSGWDEVYERNNSPWNRDEKLYLSRRGKRYGFK